MDTFERSKHITDTQVVITLRGIGELRPANANTRVSLAAETDEFNMPRAFVSIQPGAEDNTLWDATDRASDDTALVFAGGQPYEVLTEGSFIGVAAGQRAQTVLPFTTGRRDGLGTTHHEAGTLAAGTSSHLVTNADARFHEVNNLYATGPAVFPSVGSPNPMLTGTALARRLADKLAQFTPTVPEPGFTALFDGTSLSGWAMSTIRNQPGRDDSGRFMLIDGALQAITGTDIGLLWNTTPTPADFVLKLEWRTWRAYDNSGVFLRFLTIHSVPVFGYYGVRSVKQECLRMLVLFGEGSLRRALTEHIAHFHQERNHQGKRNLPLFPSPETPLAKSRAFRRTERLGGLLNFYSCAA